jgi:Na+/proline symporter
MFIYIGGALIAAALLMGSLPDDWWVTARAAGKTQIFDFASNFPLRSLLTSPYAFLTAVAGGAVLSIASHGSDHLIVQRLLSCKTLTDGRRAIIVSGFVVAAQFALFLMLGVLLWSHYEGLTPIQLGLTRGDEIFPYYILTAMPTGIAGLLIAGIVAAAMSTLSSSLNSLASSTVFDLEPMWRPLRRRFDSLGERSDLWLGRLITGFWGIVFMGFASLFTQIENSVVVLGLSIASFTYGGLLGGFVLGIVNPRARQGDAIIALVVAVFAMLLVGLIRLSPDGTLGITLPGFYNTLVPQEWMPIAWPWYPVIGTAISVLTGSLLALRHHADRAV